jgi:type VI secretion system protein ImpA
MYKELEGLLEPVSLDDVCGSNLEETDELYNLELLAKGKDETQFSEAEPPDWKQIVQQSKDLFSKSKDLWVAYHLITGLFATKGFDGLANGLEFLHSLLDKYWNSIYPLIDEEDDDNIYSFRLNPIQALFSLRGNLYSLISNTCLTKSKFFDNHQLNEIIKSKSNNNKDGKVTDFLNAIKDTPDEEVETIKNQFSQILAISNDIYKFITDKTEAENNIIDKKTFDHILTEIHSLINEAKDNKGEIIETAEAVEAVEGADVNRKAKTKNIAVSLDNLQITDRADIKRMFKVICEWYKTNEPASPVSMFVKRAESLIDKGFAEIISDIASNSVTQINTLFGESITGISENDITDSDINPDSNIDSDNKAH